MYKKLLNDFQDQLQLAKTGKHVPPQPSERKVKPIPHRAVNETPGEGSQSESTEMSSSVPPTVNTANRRAASAVNSNTPTTWITYRHASQAEWVHCGSESAPAYWKSSKPPDQSEPVVKKHPCVITGSPDTSNVENVCPKLCKVSVIPPSSISGYRGFCKVEDLPAEERRPWKHLAAKKKKQLAKKAAVKHTELKKSPPRKCTITPTTWKKEFKSSKCATNPTKNLKKEDVVEVKNKENVPSVDVDDDDEDKTEQRSSVLDDNSNSPAPTAVSSAALPGNSTQPPATVTYSSSFTQASSEKAHQPVVKKPKRETVQHVKQEKQERPPPKKRSYDRKSAREYIRKQRQLRHAKQLEEMEKQKAAREMKDQKLKSLQDLSEKLVKASIKKKPPQSQNKVLKDSEDNLDGKGKETDASVTTLEQQLRNEFVETRISTLSIPEPAPVNIHSRTGIRSILSVKDKRETSVDSKVHFSSASQVSADRTMGKEMNSASGLGDTEGPEGSVDSKSYLPSSSSGLTVIPVASTNHAAKEGSSNRERYKLTLGTKQRINSLNEKLQTALSLAKQVKFPTEHVVPSAKEKAASEEEHNHPEKSVEQLKPPLSASESSADQKYVGIERDVTGLLLDKLQMLNTFVENFKDGSSSRQDQTKKVVLLTPPPQEKKTDSITVPQSSLQNSSQIKKKSRLRERKNIEARREKLMITSASISSSSLSSEKGRPAVRSKRLTTSYPKIPSPSEFVLSHELKFQVKEEFYPGIRNLSAHVKKDYEQQVKAATKIQTAYRAYKVRRSTDRHKPTEKAPVVKESSLSVRDQELVHLLPNTSSARIQKPLCKESDERIIAERLAEEKKLKSVDLPEWLQEEIVKPCPYNIMTAVKRKFDLIQKNTVDTDGSSHVADSKEHKMIQTESSLVPAIDISEIPKLKLTPKRATAASRSVDPLATTVPASVSITRDTSVPEGEISFKTAKEKNSLENMVMPNFPPFVTSTRGTTMPTELLPQRSSVEHRHQSSVIKDIPKLITQKHSTPQGELLFTSMETDVDDSFQPINISSASSQQLTENNSSHDMKSSTPLLPGLVAPDVALVRSSRSDENSSKSVQKRQKLEDEISSQGSKSSVNSEILGSDKVNVKKSGFSVSQSQKTVRDPELDGRPTTSNSRNPDNAAEGSNTLPNPFVNKQASDKEWGVENMLHPVALHLQFQAELNLLDSVEESARQLAAVENLRAVALAQQGTSTMAAALKTLKELHQHEVTELEKKAALDEEKLIEKFTQEREEFERILKDVKANPVHSSEQSSSVSQNVKEASVHSSEYSSFIPEVSEKQSSSGRNSSKGIKPESSSAREVSSEIKSSSLKKPEEEIPSVNHSRGSDVGVTTIFDEIKKNVLSVQKTITENLEDTSLDPSIISLSEEVSERVTSSMESHRRSVQNEELSSLVKPHLKSSFEGPPIHKNPIIATTYLMYDQMIKNEELRAIEHASLLNNQEKALIDRAKADMAWLEVKKSQLREKGKEHLIPTIKKKQRAIVLKLQHDKEEIKRLKKAHKMASEERKLMLLQQQQMFKMQISGKNFPEKSKRRKSVQLESSESVEIQYSSSSSRVKAKVTHTETSRKSSKSKSSLSSTGIPTEISEHLKSSQHSSESRSTSKRKIDGDQKSVSVELDIPEENSQATSSVTSEVLTSSGNKLDSSRKKSIKSLGEQVLKYMKTLEKNERYLSEQEKLLLLRRKSVEELVQRRQRLEEEEKKLTEKENLVIQEANLQTLSINKILQDRGTSPVEILEKVTSSDKVDSKSKNSVISESIVSAYDMSFHNSNGSIPEDSPRNYNKMSDTSPHAVSAVESQTDQYISEYFESPESPETAKVEIPAPSSSSDIAEENVTATSGRTRSDEKSNSSLRTTVKPRNSSELILKAPLSPLHIGQHKRRYSSGSDESIVYSQTETPSEQSDLEGRVSALLEQLHKRKMEAEKLRREQKRARREKLKIKEQSLMKQIQAYDAYILKTKEELLEQDFETSFTKPKIKQPRVAERSTARYTDEQRKRLSLPFDPVGDNVASDAEIATSRSIKDLVEPHENVYAESANLRSLFSTRNVTTPTSLISERESTKSHIEDDQSQKSIADEAVVSDLSYSSIISEHLPSVAGSVASEKDVTEQESIEEDRSISGSQKTASLESSTETTIQTPVKFEPETKGDEHPKIASDHTSQTKDEHKSSSEIETDIKEVDHQESVSEILTATKNGDYQKSVSEIISEIYADDNKQSSSEIVPDATDNDALQKSVDEFMAKTKDDDHLRSDSEVSSELKDDRLKSSNDILLETKDDDPQKSSNEIITEIEDYTNHTSDGGDESEIEDEDHHKSSSELTSKFNDHRNKTVLNNLTDHKDIVSKLIASGVQSKAEGEDTKELKDTQLETTCSESKKSGSETVLESKDDDHKYSSDFDSTTALNKDGMSSNEKSIDIVDSQSEKSMSHISEDIPEEEHTTVSSNSAADEPSGTKSPEVIKIFLTEKSGKFNHDLTDSEVKEAIENESPELPMPGKLKEQIKPYEQFKVHSVGEDLINKGSQDAVELNLNEENLERKTNNKQYLTDSITDTILKNLLNESLSLSKKSMERVPHDLSTSITRLETELSVKDEDENLPSSEVILQGYDEPLHDSNELVEDVSLLDKTYCVQEEVDLDTQKKDQLVFSLLNQCLTDATSDVLDIYWVKKKSKQPEVTELSPVADQFPSPREERDSTNIRKRVHEILAESSLSLNLSRETSRPQDFMVTAYDILSPSPETSPAPGSPIKEPFEGNQLDLTFTADHTPEKKYEVELGVGLSAGGEPDGADNEGFAQEWFDDDFGLSHTRREAEELRLQQLQIEHEIQQLQQAQEQIPFYYVREIPNKPPPPYTPPSQTPRSSSPAPGVPRIPLSKQDLTKLASEEPRAVPASREDISALVAKATDYLYNVVEVGENLDLVNIPPDYFQDDEGDEDGSDLQKSSRKIFNKFIFDLSKQLVKDACGWEADKPCAAWEWPACSRKRKKMPPRSREILQETVNRQVLLHFGLIPRASKENLVIRWSRKRRDYVDELLVRESHEEEPGWTNYEQDEVTVKNEVTMAIWNSLLDDTVEVFTDILNKKASRQQQVPSSLSPH